MMRAKPRHVKSPPATQGHSSCAHEEERGLIQRLQAGDHEAFERLFERYLDTVYRQAMRFLGQQTEAEEVVQEVFLTVYEKAPSFRGQSAFSTWLHRITVNAALTRLRKRRRSEECSLDEYSSRFSDGSPHFIRSVMDWSNDLEERLASEEIQQLIQDAIEQLPPMDKVVVRLSELEDRSDREISATLGVSVGAVKARLHRARSTLREKVAVSLEDTPTYVTAAK